MASRRLKSRIITSVVSFVLMAFVVLILCVSVGRIAGEEVSPDTFERRTFYYYEIPFLHIQVYPITRKSERHELADWIRGRGLLPLPTNKAWELAYVARNNKPLAKGDARILTTYFESKNSADNYVWLEWSKSNPKLAAVLWPKISQLAKEGQYVFIPDLMREAKNAKSAADLTQRLDKALVKQYQDFARKHTGIGDPDTAVAILTEAIQLDAKNPSLLEQRADAFEAMSKTDEAAKDREKAKGLRGN